MSDPHEHYYAMIMAGGGGKRLWPLSRQQTPKQMLPLVEERSMFGVSVDRLAPLFPPERILVVTGKDYVARLHADAPSIPAENFIVEPSAKDSGPAAALGLTVIQQRDPQAVVAILTADHHIAQEEAFRNVLVAASAIAREQGFVVTLGISPSFPATGFGYIQRGNHLGEQRDFDYYHSLGFTEKPRADVAIQYLRSGQYSWNSGMFIWTVERAMREFERQQPTMHAQLCKLAAVIDTPAYQDTLNEVWAEIDKISLDYAVMEQAESMVVIPIDIGWNDIGSWGALYDILQRDPSGNRVRGENADNSIRIDTQETLVLSNKMVVTIGIRDVVVVETDDAILICHKDRTQEVKHAVSEMKAKHLSQYL